MITKISIALAVAIFFVLALGVFAWIMQNTYRVCAKILRQRAEQKGAK